VEKSSEIGKIIEALIEKNIKKDEKSKYLDFVFIDDFSFIVVKETPKIAELPKENITKKVQIIKSNLDKTKTEIEETIDTALNEINILTIENANNKNEITRLNGYVKTLKENIKKTDEEINKLSYVNTTLKTNFQMLYDERQRIGEEKRTLVKNHDDLKEEAIKNGHLIEDLQKTIDLNKKDNEILQGVIETKSEEILKKHNDSSKEILKLNCEIPRNYH